ncbi:ATP-binding cassette domain-containing protein [Spiribacter sp. 2438]|uniref:ABC transporter ATP-binding protein n=1 Tax=Spiribacter sp. 2438 TaxID=2666185 RepID=UPI0012B01FF2|nr:ABC transporter ATP-binding protein [Spiribacter sp. 2438]QGM20995.1 ATP-binding cassette domain-containing protein [Spiribacter sp. 2438]
MTLLALKQLGVSLGNRSVLEGADLSIGSGELVGLIGPNGIGKTTLMRAALGLLPATGYSSLAAMSAAERARTVAWMPQDRTIAWPISVEALVMLGRLPHRPLGLAPASVDRAAVKKALAAVDLEGFEHRRATRLSGGERTRALIARALAQETPLVMADEPTAGLDPAHQISAMEGFAGLARAGGAVLLSIHDLGLAARHCTRLVLLGEGRVMADGPPASVLTTDHLARIFNIEAFFQETPEGPVYQSLRVLGP